MAVRIECPICEAEFMVKTVGPKIGIRCPDCKRKFRYSDDVLADESDESEPLRDQKPAKPSDQRKSLAAISQHNQQKNNERSPSLATPAPKIKSRVPGDTSDQDQFSVAKDAEHSEPTVGAIRDSYNRRTKRQKLTSLAIGATGIVAICVLSVILYRQLNAKDSANQSPSPVVPELQSEEHDQAKLDQNNRVEENQPEPAMALTVQPGLAAQQNADSPQNNGVERVLFDDLPDRDLDYFTSKELELIWERVRPRLLSLSVRTDQGNLPSVGTIVDSRGWTLTSHQLAGKWPEVTVTAAATNIDAYYENIDAISGKNPDGQKLLTDKSKGLTGQAPKQDLALLAVNLRFVVALDKLEILPRTKIVSGLFLAQAAPPNNENPYGAVEIEVLAKQTHDELENAARDKADALSLTDPNIDWVVTEKQGSPVPGTPAFDRSGGLAARYVFSTRHYAYFLPADDALTAIKLASDSGGNKPTMPNASATDLVSVDHPMARPNELMNQSGRKCEEFGWLPTNSDEYLQLQKFSRRISTVQKFIRDNQEKESESVVLSILSNHITRWQKSMSRTLGNPKILTPAGIAEINQLALKQLNRRNLTTGGSYIPFFAKVYSAGIDEQNLDSILFQLGDKDAFVRVPFDGRNGLRPGTRWLCFFKRDKKLASRKIKLESGESAPFFTGKLSLVLGPFKQ